MQRNVFNLSFDRLFTTQLGNLTPIGIQDVLPGDTFIQNTTALIRAGTMDRPIYSRVEVELFHFFVPLRLIWDDFEKFITGGTDGLDATVAPTIPLDTDDVQSDVRTLADYLGVPSESGTFDVSALPFRAYNLIYNEYFRDPILTEAVISKGNGADGITEIALRRAAWKKDYFTTARPNTQLGDEVSVPFNAGLLPLVGTGNVSIPQQNLEIRTAAGGGGAVVGLNNVSDGAGGYWKDTVGDYPGVGAGFINKPAQNVTAASIAAQLEADLDGSTAFSIRALRIASALQRYKERRLQFGSKYTEYLKSLGVQSPDSRLQRPELLGRGKSMMQFSEVLQTGVDSADEGVGKLKGHGIGGVRSNRFKRFFSEHGFVMTMMAARPTPMYGNGLPPLWSRTTKEQYWQPELEQVGKQEVMTRELFANGATNPVFGYVDRYDDYRTGFSGIAGDFKETQAANWHLARDFASAPVLNDQFIECLPSTRIWSDQSEQHLQVFASHNVRASRLLGRPNTGRIL